MAFSFGKSSKPRRIVDSMLTCRLSSQPSLESAKLRLATAAFRITMSRHLSSSFIRRENDTTESKDARSRGQTSISDFVPSVVLLRLESMSRLATSPAD